MKKKIFLTAIGIFALILATSVSAGDFFTLTDTENYNGSIGLHLQNELSNDIFTDDSRHDAGVIHFFIDSTNVSTINAESDSVIRGERTGFVVLNHSWPSTGYIEVEMLYDDGVGGSYSSDYATVFANPGMTLKETIITPARIYSNDSIEVTFKIKAEGDARVSSINAQVTNTPKYYRYVTQSNPGSMAMGDEADFVFEFNPHGSMPGTVIYETVYLPVRIHYNYIDGKLTYLDINQSIVVFNEDQVKDLPPELTATMEAPSSIARGESEYIYVYAWNTNIGGHDACEPAFTLEADTSDISIPIHTIIPGITLEPSSVSPGDETVKFNITVTNSTSLGEHTLDLTIIYKDCNWKFNQTFTTETSFSVVEADPSEEEPEDNGTTEEDNETTGGEQITIDTGEDEPEEDEEEESEGVSPWFYVSVGLLSVIVVFIVVYLLIIRSRYI